MWLNFVYQEQTNCKRNNMCDKPKRNYFIVWNDAKTEGFITDDHQLAYETRKGSDTNCYTGDGRQCNTAIAFIGDWEEDSCTIEEVQL